MPTNYDSASCSKCGVPITSRLGGYACPGTPFPTTMIRDWCQHHDWRLPGVVQHEIRSGKLDARGAYTTPETRTGECPCGGTWGVCTYHGGKP